MLVGKRPMRRTTSMKGLTVEAEVEGPDGGVEGGSAVTWSAEQQRIMMMAMLSPRNKVRRDMDDDYHRSHFLRICDLCKRRLAPGRDIYMYKGDTAFCSEECREQRMEQDEAKARNGAVSLSPSSN